jgi:hypothetical protein
MHKRFFILLGLATLFVTTSYASVPYSDKFRYPLYLGISGGYGATTWGKLVPKDPSAAMNLSTPTSVNENGFGWGVFAGYEISPQFAVEGAYTRYPNATLFFDPTSLFTFDNNGITSFVSKTEAVSLMAKLMLFIPNTTIRGFSSAGIAAIHRDDIVKNIWRADPTFGAGFNYNLSEHWMTELVVNYTAGYGEAEVDPTKDFVPFVYSAFLRLAYRI